MKGGDTSPENEYRTVDVKMKLLTVKRSAELLESLVPQELVFYRVPIAIPRSELEQPIEPLGSSINAIGGDLPQRQDVPAPPSPSATRIFGSVSTADMVDSIKAVLAEDEEGARVVLGPEDISIVGQKSWDSEGEEDRLKALGEYGVEIRLKGAEPVRRTVSVRAQQEEEP